MGNEFEILKKIRSGSVSEQELLDIYELHKNSYRVLFFLAQHPRFPERLSLNIIPDLFPMDLLRVIKNTRTRPYIRKKAELVFTARYKKFPLGEKLSYMKIAPLALLEYFIEEEDKRVLKVILENGYCTEGLLIKFINRRKPRYDFYEALEATEWYKRPMVAESVALDEQTPIKMLLTVIPYLNRRQLKTLYKRKDTHEIVKKNILYYIDKRGRGENGSPNPVKILRVK
ncbi:MAG: hypothetical protein KAW12_17990 [Candidatus Aminicenantes bacterium]|nr:hypothetical protein [Candidatus Aminicenantes bacterium]